MIAPQKKTAHRSRRWACTAFIVLLFLAPGCDSKDEPSGASTAETEEKASEKTPRVEGKFSLSKFEVSASQGVYQIDEAPKPEAVEAQLEEAVYAIDTFAKGGSRELSGRVTYDVRPLPDDGGWDVMLIGGVSSADASFEAGANYKSTDERWKGKSLDEMVEGAVGEFADKVAAQSRVLGADLDGVVAILNSEEEPKSAKLMAIQEIRERNATDHLGAVRPYLGDEHSAELRTAAAATLVGLGDEESRAEILKAAEDLSRAKDPQYVPMLHILADLGGREIITYLEAVAEGHSAPAVRRVAQEALADAREKRGAP